MAEIKLSATILLPGGRMVGYAQAHKEKKTTVRVKGHTFIKTEVVKIPEMFDNFEVILSDSKGKERKNVQVRKCPPAKQVMYINEEAYNYWVGKEKPAEYREATPWLKLSKNQKIMWHLEQIAHDLGGTVGDFSYID